MTKEQILSELHVLLGGELDNHTDSPDYDQGIVDGIERAIEIVEQF